MLTPLVPQPTTSSHAALIGKFKDDIYTFINPAATTSSTISPAKMALSSLSAVSSNTPPIDGVCGGDFPMNSTVKLIATPTNSLFDSWSGACTGIGACAPVMSESRVVTATFTTAMLGDVNGDNTVNVFDALLTLQYSVGLVEHTSENNAKYLATADVAPLDLLTAKPKADGQVNVFDALAILRHAVGLDAW